jgi:hypothetical protein
MSEDTPTARVQLSWTRRQWLKITALAGDHPGIAVLVLGGSLGLILFYGIRLGGFSHFLESGARWRMETFGGSHHVERSVQTPDVLLSLKQVEYDRLDVTAPTAIHLGGTAFRKELRRMVLERGGQLRINALDPRLADPDHPSHQRFVSLAEVFGMTEIELAARCWYSTAVLLHLEEEFGDGVQIRLISQAGDSAAHPYFCIGRSGQSYFSDDPKTRLDVIIPRPAEPTFSNSFTHPGVIIKDRPKQAEVIRFTAAFNATWANATPLDQALQDELRTHLDGQSNPGN